MKNGSFVISLDFELHWGIFDHTSVEQYQENLDAVKPIIHRLLELAHRYEVELTFATVGFLFARSKKELKTFMPSDVPSYTFRKYDPYALLDVIGDSEENDPYHYAPSLIEEIRKHPQHEIGTHTFSHYYCLEDGQTAEQFRQDIEAAVAIAGKEELELQSIVFPRNQLSHSHLKVCKDFGITSYRGTENHWVFKHGQFTNANYLTRLIRLADSYVNITGSNTYNQQKLKDSLGLMNLPSSRFLRPFSKKLSFLESLKIRRITKGMKYAARRNELFHLWWHPHNFGKNTDENFKNLEEIFKTYKELNETYGFDSVTMTKLTKLIDV